MNDEIKLMLQQAVTVQWLLDELSHMPPDARVMFSCDYGDHCHTEQLLPVGNTTEFDPDEQKIYKTAYSNSGLAVSDIDEEDDDFHAASSGFSKEPSDEVAVVILSV